MSEPIEVRVHHLDGDEYVWTEYEYERFSTLEEAMDSAEMTVEDVYGPEPDIQEVQAWYTEEKTDAR